MRLSATKPNLLTIEGRTFTLRAACARTHYGAPDWGIPRSSGGECYAYAFEARKGTKHLDDAWLVETRSGVLGIVELGEWTFQRVTERIVTPQWMHVVCNVPQATTYLLSARLLYGAKTLVGCLERV